MKTQDLLNIKKRLGLPDARFTPDVCPLAEAPDSDADSITLLPPRPCACALSGSGMCSASGGGGGDVDADDVVREVTEAVMAALQARGR